MWLWWVFQKFRILHYHGIAGSKPGDPSRSVLEIVASLAIDFRQANPDIVVVHGVDIKDGDTAEQTISAVLRLAFGPKMQMATKSQDYNHATKTGGVNNSQVLVFSKFTGVKNSDTYPRIEVPALFGFKLDFLPWERPHTLTFDIQVFSTPQHGVLALNRGKIVQSVVAYAPKGQKPPSVATLYECVVEQKS